MAKIFMTQFRELPFSEFLKLVGKSVLQSNPLIIYARDVVSAGSTESREMPDFTIEKGDLSELGEMGQRLKPLPWEFQCHLFDNVKDFFVARNGGGIQHISWIYYHDNHNRILTMGEKEAEIKFCLTLPAARGKGVYPCVIGSILDYLRWKGMNRAFMCVHRDNLPSIRGIEKAGFHPVGRIRLRKVFGVQISRKLDTSEV
jgi:GNAT superfamily N-acetyltransferase